MSTRWNLTDDEAKSEIGKLVFVMSGVNEADKLAKIQDMLGDVARGGEGGLTWDAAHKKMTALLESDLGGDSAARAELALRTVIFRAKATQKYRTLMKQRRIFPYWEYRSRNDGRDRESHVALNGKIFPAGHPIWQRIFPPWGWGCRCIVIPRRANDIEKMLQEDEKKDPADQRVWDGEMADAIYKGERLPGGQSLTTEDVYRSPAESGMELWTEDELKERYADHPVIQKRFNLYLDKMPAKLKAVRTAQVTKRTEHKEKFPTVAKALQPNRNTKKLVAEVTDVIDEVHGDGVLPEIPVDGNPGRQNHGAFVHSGNPGTGKKLAVKIGVRVKDDHPGLTLVHEMGHFLDFAGLGNNNFATVRPDGLMKDFLDLAKSSAAFKGIPNHKNGRYYKKNVEVFARAYAQWIATKSGNKTLMSELDGIRNGVAPWRQWSDEDFAPISKALDLIFEEKEWLRPAK